MTTLEKSLPFVVQCRGCGIRNGWTTDDPGMSHFLCVLCELQAKHLSVHLLIRLLQKIGLQTLVSNLRVYLWNIAVKHAEDEWKEYELSNRVTV